MLYAALIFSMIKVMLYIRLSRRKSYLFSVKFSIIRRIQGSLEEESPRGFLRAQNPKLN